MLRDGDGDDGGESEGECEGERIICGGREWVYVWGK